MSALKFVDSHNMVAFLAKPTKSDGFEQILDFLNANPIKYALTINPTIYTSCIEQFWATEWATAKDAEGIECLPNADIFEQLALMGYEKPSQKLTFYKAFFSPQWKFLIHTILQMHKLRVKRLEKKGGSRTHKLKRLFKVGRSAQVVSFKDEEVTLVDETQGRYDDAQMFDTDVFNGEEVFIAEQSEKVVEEVVCAAKDKGKAKMIKLEKPLKMKEQIRLDEELAFKLKAEEEEQARLADRLLAERLQAREQEELTDEENARLFVELLEKRKKHFASLRDQEKRKQAPTKAQKKSTMSTNLKNMAGYKQSQLKNKLFAEIQKLFDKAMTKVNMFVDMDTELVKESSKKAEEEIGTKSSF
ncbi:hypothetical protein Tco_1092007 [Tanacetum coccineum]|uniref:Uncharacterized protein n=1 Tax=Tanacetum coccineum TaxID=301880 RepID=A0ABQ5I8M8_9ASTR